MCWRGILTRSLFDSGGVGEIGAHEVWASQTDLGMLLFQPARLANPLEIVLGMLEKSLERLALVLEVRPVPLDEEVEIDLVGVELGAVDAGELGTRGW